MCQGHRSMIGEVIRYCLKILSRRLGRESPGFVNICSVLTRRAPVT